MRCFVRYRNWASYWLNSKVHASMALRSFTQGEFPCELRQRLPCRCLRAGGDVSADVALHVRETPLDPGIGPVSRPSVWARFRYFVLVVLSQIPQPQFMGGPL